MFEYVKDYNLKFREKLVKRNKTDLIILHHSEGGFSETVQSIHTYHLSKGHKGIDYNICVQSDGTVVWGRGLETVGGHTNNSYPTTKGVNARSVGIVALGNFNVHAMPDSQKEMLKKITRDVLQYYGIKDIKTHKEIAGGSYTNCPGRFFPTEEVKAYALGYESITPDEKDPYVWFVSVGVLNFRQAPSLRAAIIKQLKKGDVVYLDRLVDYEDFARVSIKSGNDVVMGYVWKNYIEPTF